MIGAIVGDIVGSLYEFDNIRTKDFPLFTSEKDYTDDSILTIATADWLLHGGSPERYYWGVCHTSSISYGKLWRRLRFMGKACATRLRSGSIQ